MRRCGSAMMRRVTVDTYSIHQNPAHRKLVLHWKQQIFHIADMTKRLTTVILATWLPLAPLPALAAREAACPPARAGISDLGYSSYRDGATFRGSTIDVLAEMRKRSGCDFNIEWYPHGRLYAQFFNSQLELTGASLRTAERDQHGVWLPYSYTQFELLLTNHSAGKFHSLAEFVEHSSARLNVTRGISYSPETQAQMDRLQKLGRLEYVNDYGVVFRKILAGRAEGTLAPPAIHVLHQRRFKMLGKMTGTPFAESPRALIGMYVSKNVSPQVLHSYAEALRSIVADGTVQKIYERYLGEEITRQIFAAGVHDILNAMPH
jgi:polar amino acid transport system substrate-binding protein